MQIYLFNKRIKALGLSREEFSILSNTSISTINGWGTTRSDKRTPQWVDAFLDIYEKNIELRITLENLLKLTSNWNNK